MRRAFLGAGLAVLLLTSCAILRRGQRIYPPYTTESGLVIQELLLAPGPVAALGDRVELHYTGLLPSGERFDSSLDRDEPIRITLGAGEVKPGIEEGLLGMAVHGQRKIVVPPELAYGDEGLPGVIPASATLTFELELLAIESQ